MVIHGAIYCYNSHSVIASPVTTPPIIRANICTKHPSIPTSKGYKCSGFLRLQVNQSIELSLKAGIRAAVTLAETHINGSVVSEEEVALVWFKHDLRTDDHPGLVKASQYKTLVPVYIFDQYICSRLSSQMLEMLIDAVKNLKNALKDRGSDLIIRFGRTEDIFPTLVKEVNATHIITEEEGEYDWLKLVHSVSESLSTIYVLEENPRIVFWQAHLFEFESVEEIPDSYREYRKTRRSSVLPLSCPTLPVFHLDVDRGLLPDIKSLRENMKGTLPSYFQDNWGSIKSASASSILEGAHLNDASVKTKTDQIFREQLEQEEHPILLIQEDVNKMAIGGGTATALDALAGYFRYSEATGRGDWQELRERIRATETRPGASFRVIFGFALSLGTISRRRVYHEALKYERERNAGWLNPLGYSVFTIGAAVEDSISMEWYWLLALKSQHQGIKKGVSIRTWRWRGYLVQYTTAGQEGPAVALVHGFGAFWEHYRDNIIAIANNGYRVYAITLLGFGRSEKPNIVYTELLWAELLRDFFVAVVGEPVHIVGNSFGGYLVSLVARLWPALVKSLVLCNTGGTVVQNYSAVKYLKPNPNSAVSQLGARFLLFYLKAMAKRMLKKFYPTNPERADEWLLGEILRASYDPNTVAVLESIVDLKLSLPINYLLDSYNKKVLLIQGNKDPLFQSKRTASFLKQQCNTVVLEDVNAGHCPHDEIPNEVNSIINGWIKQIEVC